MPEVPEEGRVDAQWEIRVPRFGAAAPFQAGYGGGPPPAARGNQKSETLNPKQIDTAASGATRYWPAVC
jgi:hypothetical protein